MCQPILTVVYWKETPCLALFVQNLVKSKTLKQTKKQNHVKSKKARTLERFSGTQRRWRENTVERYRKKRMKFCAIFFFAEQEKNVREKPILRERCFMKRPQMWAYDVTANNIYIVSSISSKHSNFYILLSIIWNIISYEYFNVYHWISCMKSPIWP